MSRNCGRRWESPRKNARANMFTKGQLNRVLKWEKPWQIYLHARMAPTWPLLEEQNTEKRQQASLERWFYGPLAGKPTRPFRLRHNFGLRSFLAPVSFCCLMAASVCSGHHTTFKWSPCLLSRPALLWSVIGDYIDVIRADQLGCFIQSPSECYHLSLRMITLWLSLNINGDPGSCLGWPWLWWLWLGNLSKTF